MTMAIDLATRVEEALLTRNRVYEDFFAREAPRLAEACREMSERFLRGGRLLAFGRGPYATDAQHVSVEFVHPVIVGKRALPALAIDSAGLDALREPDDAVVSFEPLRFGLGENEWRFDPPSDDSFVRQELCETLYHVVWELVHVFFEHLGGSAAGADPSEIADRHGSSVHLRHHVSAGCRPAACASHARHASIPSPVFALMSSLRTSG